MKFIVCFLALLKFGANNAAANDVRPMLRGLGGVSIMDENANFCKKDDDCDPGETCEEGDSCPAQPPNKGCCTVPIGTDPTQDPVTGATAPATIATMPTNPAAYEYDTNGMDEIAEIVKLYTYEESE